MECLSGLAPRSTYQTYPTSKLSFMQTYIDSLAPRFLIMQYPRWSTRSSLLALCARCCRNFQLSCQPGSLYHQLVAPALGDRTLRHRAWLLVLLVSPSHAPSWRSLEISPHTSPHKASKHYAQSVRRPWAGILRHCCIPFMTYVTMKLVGFHGFYEWWSVSNSLYIPNFSDTAAFGSRDSTIHAALVLRLLDADWLPKITISSPNGLEEES